MATITERFWSKVRKTDGCWLWTDAPHKPWGYGRLYFYASKTEVKAHRLCWELHFGPIPSGLGVLHRCDTPLCVRPDHLFLGTDADNIRDMTEKGRNGSGSRATTHCPQGHRYDDANTYIFRGMRQCRVCRKRHAKAYRKRCQERRRHSSL